MKILKCTLRSRNNWNSDMNISQRNTLITVLKNLTHRSQFPQNNAKGPSKTQGILQ